MSTTSDELSLINGSEFLEELTQRLGEPAPDPSMPPPQREPAYADEFFSLDSGLPMGADAPVPNPNAADEDREPLGHPYDAGPLPAYEERGIPLFAAVAVLIACLTGGAAIAAVVFHDRLAVLTSLMASR